MGNHFIAVAGNIGAGKSTLAKALADQLQWKYLLEVAEANPYLPLFYQDMRRWSFHSQTFFLIQRLEQYPKLIHRQASIIQDRTIYEDAQVFARNLFEQGNMPQEDFQLYNKLYEAIVALVPPPDLLIYLDANVDTLLQRIEKRGRRYEQRIEREYLIQLDILYKQWVASYKLSPVIRVLTDTRDFTQAPGQVQQIVAEIQATLRNS